MKIIKYIGATLLVILGISQVMPIYLISSGLLQGQGGDDTSYFIGKLLGHLFVTVLVLALASKLFNSAKNMGCLVAPAYKKYNET